MPPPDLPPLRVLLALPRVSGSPAHAAVRERLAGELERRGFGVARQPFPAPATRVWLTGVLAGLLTLVSWAAAAQGLGHPRLALSLAALAALAAFLSRHFVRLERTLARSGENLIGTRAGAPPRVWLVAHYDTKGQRLSMAGRLVAAILVATGGVGLILAGSAAAMDRMAGPWSWIAIAVLTSAGGIPLAAAGLRNESPGAVDNGSGVLAALATVDALPPDIPVGIAFTDAEELGLLGARALAREHGALLRDAAVINFDGLDDRGAALALVHRPGPVTRAVAATLDRRWRWLPVVVDGLALAPAARETLTVLKGNWETMRVVHTPADHAERLTYAGVDAVSRAVAAALGPILNRPAATEAAG